MEELKHWDSEETLEEIKKSITVDEVGMFAMLNKRIVITPQETFGNMMKAAASLAGINAAKILMREAGYEIAKSVSKIMVDVLNLKGNDLIVFYCETAGKRGWGFNAVKEVDVPGGKFRTELHFSPFVTGFTEKTKVPVCDFQAGAIEAMFHAAGNKNVKIIETKCVAMGDSICVFENK